MPFPLRIFFLFLLLISRAAITFATPANSRETALDTATARAFRVGAINRDSAIHLLEDIYKQCEQAHYIFGQASALMACGVLHANGEESAAPALAYFRRAAPFIDEAAKKNDGIRARWYTCMGAASLKTERMDSAMYYYTLSLNANLKRKQIDYASLLQNYVNIEILYYEQQQYDKALLYARKVITLAREKDFKYFLFSSYLLTAGIYVELKNADSSDHYLTKAEQVPVKPKDSEQKLLYELRGIVALHRNLPEKAIPYYEAALKVNNIGSTTSLRGLGNAYYKLHNYPLAEQYLLRAKKQEEVIRQHTFFLIDLYNELAELYNTMERYKEAYDYRTDAARMTKELMEMKRNEMINQLETKYRSAEQENQITQKRVALLSAENNLRKKNIWIVIVLTVALSMTIITLLLYQKQKTQKHRNASQRQQQEIEKLKAVINAEEKERSRIGRELHDDIMGQLSIIKINMEVLPNSIPMLLQSEEYEDIKELVDNAGKDIRQTAHNLTPDALLSEGLVRAILYFTNNMQRRTGMVINFQHYGYKTLLGADIEISLYRIIQELLQNIVKHAKASSVLVQLSQREDMLTLAVEDDGIGLPPDHKTKGGLGLKSIDNRLKALNGSMDIHQRKPKGTSVTIEIMVTAPDNSKI